jgi:uncharacterized protein YjdB
MHITHALGHLLSTAATQGKEILMRPTNRNSQRTPAQIAQEDRHARLSNRPKPHRRRVIAASLARSAPLALAGLIVLTTSALASGRSAAEHTMTTTAAPSICYRAHVENIAWQPQVCDGDIAGTIGQSLRLEALEIVAQGAGTVCAAAHVEGIGWMNTRCVGDGGTVVVGTTGRGLRMEALRLSVSSGAPCVNAHVEGIGWQGYRCGNAVEVGTTGESRRMEAISLFL